MDSSPWLQTTAPEAISVLITVDPEIPVPPRHYGGIERIVAGLVGELRTRGARVVLAAHPDSTVDVTLRPWPGLESRGVVSLARNTRHVGALIRTDGPFDVVHSFGRLAYVLPYNAMSGIPLVQSYQRHISPRSFGLGLSLGRINLVFTACGSACWPKGAAADDRAVVIPNFAPVSRFSWSGTVADDAPLVFLGRVERLKGPDIAIDVAELSGRRLVIAGNHAETGEEATFFRDEVLRRCDGTRVRYLGPVDDELKVALLKTAAALLMPVRWEEPFGIVMAEALACGTPVIGLRRGAVPEVVQDGVTGFVCRDVEEMVAAVGRLDEIRRAECRREAESRFSVEVVTSAYLKTYARVRAESSGRSPHSRASATRQPE